MRPLALHPGLSSHTRILPGERTSLRMRELAFLFLCGAAAIVVAEYVKLPIKQMPGKAILQTMIPLAIGLAVVPRYGAGSTMSLAGLLTYLTLRGTTDINIGVGSMTSALVTGLCLDVLLLRVQRGVWLYLGFVLAGLSSNLIAMLARGTAKIGNFDDLFDRPWEVWRQQAIITYPLFGILAGLICAAVFFSLRRRDANKKPALEPTP